MNLTEEALAPATVDQLGEDQFFIAASPALHQIRALAELLANIDVPVLLLGESGTGKEVTARLIHSLSYRSQRPFMKVNCAALPAELLESELFGYERGAFTGAVRTKAGRFELCDRGTILLDEIAEMPANLQAKLLHAIQDKQFFRLGGEASLEVDVRILAATNMDIQEAIANRGLREDLYYRLSAFTIFLPPLRERPEEIPLLLRHFTDRMVTQYCCPPVSLSLALIEACVRYPWPGNLRELENFVKRHVVLRDDAAAINELQTHFHGRSAPVHSTQKAAVHTNHVNPANDGERARNLKFLVRNLTDETEIQAITKALLETNWNRTRAAQLLQISYRGLLYKIQRHGIRRPSGSEVTRCLKNGETTT